MNRDNQNSCIMDKLYSVNDSNVETFVQPNITSSYDFNTAKRVWNLTLDSTTESKPQITIYKGIYRLKFLLVDEPQIIY